MSSSRSAVLAEPDHDTIIVEDGLLCRGYVQLPKLVLYARNLSRDAKLLYAVLLGYAWQEQRCFPGYQRLCADLEASENAVRTWMRELEDAHLISQRRRGQGRTNVYIFHNLRTAKIEVQEHHTIAVVEPQKAQDNEEAVHKEKEHKASDVRTSKGTLTSIEAPRNEPPFTHSAVFSTAKDKVLRALAGQQTKGFSSLQQDASPPQGQERRERAKGQRKKEDAQTHQLAAERSKSTVWLPGYIVDFSREFHDEAATASNITRAAHLFERAGMDADAFIAQVYAARHITQGRASIRKRAEVGKNPAWPDGFPNRMPYFFSVLEDRLGLKEAPKEA
jgi:DNA-binding transcriptional ArsR family regulator